VILNRILLLPAEPLASQEQDQEAAVAVKVAHPLLVAMF
jgi:hypothetical protein